MLISSTPVLQRLTSTFGRRGRRQYLQPVRMEDMRKTWLTNSIPSAVARRIEVQSDAGGWESL